MTQLTITMFGEFSLQTKTAQISDNDNRSKKVWILLAYLICKRDRSVSRKELIHLLWGNDAEITNPENTLKITFYRLRTLLNQLWPSAGHDLILFQDSGYRWNPDVSCFIDVENFDRLQASHSIDDAVRLQNILNAVEIYKGDFLSNLSSEGWVIPIAAHYHNIYIETILEAIPLLTETKQHQTVSELCKKALTIEPYHEPLYLHLMMALAELNDKAGAIKVYEELLQRLSSDFGIQPNKELRTCYRSLINHTNNQTLPLEAILEDLIETDAKPGALLCDYDYFKILCHAEARAMIRTGNATHIAMFSITGRLDEKPLSSRSLKIAMEHLENIIQTNLRRGDAFSKCSSSQFIVMLPRANYENSCMVCRRVIGAFFKKHTHSPVKIHSMVQSLAPDTFEQR